MVATTDLWVYNAENLCVSFFYQVTSIFHLRGGEIKKKFFLGTPSLYLWSSQGQSSTVNWKKLKDQSLPSTNILHILMAINLMIKMTGRPGQTRPLTWTNMALSWEKICKLIFFQIPFGIWWHWVSRGHYLLVLGGTGSVLGGTDWYLIVLGR